MGKLLIIEHPLLVLPSLANAIGLNEAIILQQIHYWSEINRKKNNNLKDDHFWTYNTLKEWNEQFPFWGERTVDRALKRLEKLKLIVTGNYNKLPIDRTKWYRIDYKALKTLMESPLRQNDVSITSICLDHLDNMTLPLPETSSKNSSKTSRDNNTSFPSKTMDMFLQSYDSNYKDAIEDVLVTYYRFYEHYTGKKHPILKTEQLERIYYELELAIGCHDDLDDMIEHFFLNVKKTDFNVNHFATSGMLEILSERVR
jgi:hypothetical protein